MIAWTDAAIEAALNEYFSGNRTAAEDMRAALDAALQAQGMQTFCDSCAQCSRADALGEAARLLDRENQPMLADSIRALKEVEL